MCMCERSTVSILWSAYTRTPWKYTCNSVRRKYKCTRMMFDVVHLTTGATLVPRLISSYWHTGRKSLVTLGGFKPFTYFRCLNLGSSNQIAEQNHADAWLSKGMAKKQQDNPWTVTTALSTAEGMANLLSKGWTFCLLCSVLLLLKNCRSRL